MSSSSSISESSIGQLLWELLKFLGTWLKAFIYKRFWPLFVIVVSLLLGFLVWTEYHRQTTKNITFYTGTWASLGRDYAQRISETLNNESGHQFQGGYAVVPRSSNYDDSRKNISVDRTGLAIGFARDGFGDRASVNVLLPLDWDYLHILCRKELYDKVRHASSTPATHDPLTVLDIISYLSADHKNVEQELRGKVFLGLPGSDTEEVAELVLDKCRLPIDKVSADNLSTKQEMRAAFVNGTIDLAFYTCPINSPFIQQLANDETCVLISLSDERDSLLQENLQLAKASFKPNAYTFGDFCPHEIQTVASREVLVCSPSMSEIDAYAVSKAANEALSDIENVSWDMSPPSEEKQERHLIYTVHAGAKLFQSNAAPKGSAAALLTYLFSLIGLWAVVDLLQFTNSWLRNRKRKSELPDSSRHESEFQRSDLQHPDLNASAADTSSDMMIDRIVRAIDNEELILLKTVEPLNAVDQQSLSSQLDRHATAIQSAVRDGKLDPVSARRLAAKIEHVRQLLQESALQDSSVVASNSQQPAPQQSDSHGSAKVTQHDVL